VALHLARPRDFEEAVPKYAMGVIGEADDVGRAAVAFVADERPRTPHEAYAEARLWIFVGDYDRAVDLLEPLFGRVKLAEGRCAYAAFFARRFDEAARWWDHMRAHEPFDANERGLYVKVRAGLPVVSR
jgi:hypothetical protein